MVNIIDYNYNQIGIAFPPHGLLPCGDGIDAGRGKT